jgi:hypothetical protein
MKKLIMVTLLAATLAAQAQDEITVEPTSSGIGALIGIDLLGEAKWEAIKSARWYRKPDTALRAYVVGPIARNPGKTLAGVAASLVAIRAADGKLDDDLKGLWEDLGLRDESKTEPKPEPAAELFDGTGATTHGDNSPIYMETDDENAAAQTYGNNSPITIVKPQPEEVEE